MKKIISLCAILLAVLTVLASCNTQEEPCTSHTDEDKNGICDVCSEELGDKSCTSHVDSDSNGKCDVCEADTLPPEVKMNCTITVVDQDGALISGAVITLYKGYDSVLSATSDENGVIAAELSAGNYTFNFDFLPDGYLPISTGAISFDKGAESVELLVQNVTPDGSEERPFIVPLDAPSITLESNAAYYFSLGTGTKVLKVNTDDVEIVYDGNTYSGKNAEIKLSPKSNFTPSVAKFINKSNTEKTFELVFESVLGSPERPIEAALETIYTASVEKEQTVYYRWIATKSGMISVTSYSENGTIMLYNKTTYEVSPYTDGKVCEYVWVNAGDELSVAVASTSSSSVSDVEFRLLIADANADSPIILLDSAVTVTIPAGKEYSFVSLLLGADTVSIKNKNIKVEINGSELTPDENGNFKYVFAAGDVITVINVSSEKHDVTIKLSTSSEN
ncbi:MAG: hypothetical protein E7626_03630 [Ruminococcaceae bacterium]|nr:hypothetical protein [Oscillospiraceae bacterium]